LEPDGHSLQTGLPHAGPSPAFRHGAPHAATMIRSTASGGDQCVGVVECLWDPELLGGLCADSRRVVLTAVTSSRESWRSRGGARAAPPSRGSADEPDADRTIRRRVGL
jgi:hypothetical protein